VVHFLFIFSCCKRILWLQILRGQLLWLLMEF